MHIGNKINEVLAQKHMTKQELGRSIGFSGSAATYLTTRPTVDVETLQKIGNFLKYNFFKHYPVEDGSAALTTGVTDERDKIILELKNKISELEKNLESCVRNQAMQKQENAYLKKINELLERK